MGQSSPFAPQIVLVVEDEPLQRMMAVDLVEAAGYEVVEAAGADEAVAILENRPDIRLVLTDIDMPGGSDGLKLAAMIRDRWPPIELIVISGKRTVRPDELPARSVFLSKPYKRDELTKVLRRLMT